MVRLNMIKIESYYSDNLDLLKETRDFMIKKRDETNSENELMGLNYNIILNSVLILEGEFEKLLFSIVQHYENMYIQKVSQHEKLNDLESGTYVRFFLNQSFNNMREKISKNTGLKHYKSMLEELIHNYQNTAEMKKLEEGVETLFQLRNVLAHGRAIRFNIKSHMPYPTYNVESIESDFKGGYKKAEDYLIKHGLLSNVMTQNMNFYQLFENDICNHFVDISQKYLQACRDSIPFEI